VIKKLPNGNLKTIDFNKSQSTGSPTTYSSRPKWKNGRNSAVVSGYGTGFTNEEIEALRKQMYQDYDIMDTDAIVSSVLDIFSDESSCVNEQGELLVIKTDDVKVKKVLHNLFYDIMNIEFNLWSWIRTSVKYGDNFLYLQVEEEVGVINVMPIHPMLMIREEGSREEPDQVRFKYEGDFGAGSGHQNYFQEYEIAHFRLLGDVNFLPYGRSNLEGGRKEYKRMCLPSFSKIWTETGFVEIGNIAAGDCVFSFDYLNKKYIKSTVKEQMHNGQKEVFEIRLSNRKFYGTADHLYLTSDGEYKQVSDLTTDDYIILSNLLDQQLPHKLPLLKLNDNNIVANFDDGYFHDYVQHTNKKCIICDKEMKHLNSWHLKYKHNMKFSDYTNIVGTANYFHLMNRNVKIPLDDAMKFCVAYNLNTDKLKSYSPNSTVEIINEVKLTENFKQFVRFFGFLLGDGWIDDNAVKFSLGNRIDKSQKYLEFLNSIDCKFTISNVGKPNAECNIRNLYFVKLLRQLKFITGTSNKIVPDWIFAVDVEHKLEFLLGFADADGCDTSVQKNNTRFSVGGINKNLLETLQTIAIQIGLNVSNMIHTAGSEKFWKTSNKYYKSKDVYTFSFSLTNHHKTVIKNGLLCQKVIKIDSVGIQDVYDIEVDNINHNFIVDGVISHNCLAEDAMLLNRIMRAPERRLFKIDIGNIAPEEVDAYIEEISNTMKKTPYIDPLTGEFNLRYNLINSQEDFFMPVRGGDSGTSIETLPGLSNDGMLEDVEYFKNKMIAAFKIPKSYIGYSGDEDSGGDGKSLAQLDIRFARTIERIQKIFVSELYKIAIIHLKVQGFETEDLLNFELTLTNPSLIFERQKTDVLTAKVDLAKSAREENPLLSDNYIYKNIFGFTDEEIQNEMDAKVESAKYAFRIKQIQEEGNDPEVTGKSFGTPHDIATMQVSSKYMPGQYEESDKSLYNKDEREENKGKPDQYAGSFETERDKDFGRDPVGRKENAKTEMPETFKRITKSLDKMKKVKKEPASMLNEDNLIIE